MAHPIIVIVVFFGVIAVTAVIFFLWVCMAICRGIFRMLGWGARTAFPKQRPPALPLNAAQCSRDKCRATNRPDARFCRRCGQPLIVAQSALVRRVAMW